MGKRLENTFPKEDTQMAQKYMKRCFTSLIIREMQTKPWDITSHPFAWQLEKPEKRKCWRNLAEQQASCPAGGNVNGAAAVENSSEVPQTLNTESSHEPVIPFLGLPTGIETGTQTDNAGQHSQQPEGGNNLVISQYKWISTMWGRQYVAQWILFSYKKSLTLHNMGEP